MDYEIIATLGPSSETQGIWREMLLAGVTAFRLNTSHLTLVQLAEWLEKLAPILKTTVPQVPLVLDLQGSKWRLGQFPAFQLVKGQQVRLVHAPYADNSDILPVPHADFFIAARNSSDEIMLNDAKISLIVERLAQDWILARVTRGGLISPNKGITFISSSYRLESLGEKDQAILARTREISYVRYALSYVKDADEMAHYRKLFGHTYLIAKLERQQAVEQIAQVAASADELWLCRGDLGAELGLKAMAEAAHQVASKVQSLPRPVILAGQVLEHMTVQPTPTRAEVCALYDALAVGYHGFVLSDETAVGQYPLESCRIAALYR